MQTEYTPKRPLSGFQRRKVREAQGWPRYTPAEARSRLAADKRRSEKAYALRRALVDNLKLKQGCADCGYRAHPAALTFDHLPGNTKVDDIARLANRRRGGLDVLRAEIAKCEVVCANCHAIRTANRRGKG